MSAPQDQYAHFVPDAASVEVGLEQGLPVTALCGKVWVPSRDPARFSSCPECAEALRHGWAA